MNNPNNLPIEPTTSAFEKLIKNGPKIEQMRDPLKTLWNQELVDAKESKESEDEKLLKLIDFSQMNDFFESFLEVMGLPVAIIDLKGAVLASSKWQRICVEFHRTNPETLTRCVESDQDIHNQIEAGRKYSSHQCGNGLIDCAAPIIVEGRHLANLFIGQFFINPPDPTFFKQQQEAFGFDENDYFAAIAEVPVVNQKKLPSVMALLVGWAEEIAGRSLAEKRAISALASVEQQVKERTEELIIANQKLEALANLDGLTHIANRRCFDRYLDLEWLRHQREKFPLALILIDIDYFKNYNDYYGHQQGDDCLIQVAQTINKIPKRPTDLVARYGGEEFVVTLPNTDTKGAVKIAEAIREAIALLNITHAKSMIRDYVTLSLGVASVIPTQEMSPEDLIKQADNALYQAKNQGRDLVRYFP